MRTIEHADRFARTMVDFWRLRPRDFLATAKRDGSAYLSPNEFLVFFLSIGFVIYSTSISLVLWATQGLADEALAAPAKALAIRTLVLIVSVVVVGALFNRAISRVWPIRGCATLKDILDFRFYQLSLLLPLMVIDLLVAPLLGNLVTRGLVPESSILFLSGGGFLVGIVLDVVKGVPGLAAVNEVSTARAWAGLLYWSTMVGVLTVVVGSAIVIAALVLGG